MKTLEQIAEIKKSFDAMTEKEQWSWLINTDTELRKQFDIYLDNDETHIYFNQDEEANYALRFKADIGNRAGVDYILDSLNFNYQSV